MTISDLIKQATDILSLHGDLLVDVEYKDDNKEYKRVIATQIDLQIRRQGFKEFVFVVVGGKADQFE